jgi:hypothetical protein
LAASISITALSAASSVRYVSSPKSWWPGVSRVPAIRKLQDGRGDRDAALAFEIHPVGGCLPRAATRRDLAGGIDRAAVQEQFFRKGRFAGVGVRDDRKGATLLDRRLERRKG